MNIGTLRSVDVSESASRSKFIPLVTKKNGIRKPKPTAVSLDSSTSTSLPRRASRVTIPATKPPRSSYCPRLPASATSPNTMTTARRTASWLLASSVRSSRGQPRQAERTETIATASASTENAISSSASCTGF